MKRLNYSTITSTIRRIHEAKKKSDATGIPVRELLDQDRELRKRLAKEREEQKQRRDFLRAAGGLGLGAALLPFASPARASQPSIAIVGGGTGGLRTAHRLMQYGLGSTVYEAGDRVGGRMYSDRTFFSDGRVVEYGGEFISTEHNAIRNLAHQLNLQLEDVNKLSVGDEETYLIENVLYSEAQLMDVWVEGLYDIMKRAQQNAPWQPTYNSYIPQHQVYDDLDAIAWMESPEVGLPRSDWVHKLLLADLVAEYGITEGNSALNLIYLLGWNTHNSGGLPLAGTDERLHVIGGNDLIPQRMADQLPPGSVQLDMKLEEIHGSYGGPFSLKFKDVPQQIECDVLVLALPMNLIKELYIAPDIYDNFSPQKRMGFESTTNVSDNGKVMMEFDDRHWDRFTTIDGEQVHQAARAYSFSGTMTGTGTGEFPGEYAGFISTWEGEPGNPSPLGVLVNYNGGSEARNLQSWLVDGTLHGPAHPDDVNRTLAQAEQIWPGIGDKYRDQVGGLVSSWIYDPLARSAFTSPSTFTMTHWWGAQWESEIAGRVFFAGEAYDEEYWSYMNGAVLSGERIAKEIHQNF
jgi:monoamine oxidase